MGASTEVAAEEEAKQNWCGRKSQQLPMASVNAKAENKKGIGNDARGIAVVSRRRRQAIAKFSGELRIQGQEPNLPGESPEHQI